MTNPEHIEITTLLKKLRWAIEDLKQPLIDISTELSFRRKNV